MHNRVHIYLFTTKTIKPHLEITDSILTVASTDFDAIVLTKAGVVQVVPQEKQKKELYRWYYNSHQPLMYVMTESGIDLLKPAIDSTTIVTLNPQKPKSRIIDFSYHTFSTLARMEDGSFFGIDKSLNRPPILIFGSKVPLINNV